MKIHIKSKIKWTRNEAGDHDGVGEHAVYKVHQLKSRQTGVSVPLRRGWYTARKLGQNPFKIIGGPYKTMTEAKLRAEGVEGM